MITILKTYSSIISAYEIRRYQHYGSAYEFVAKIVLTDGTELHVRDYLFLNGDRKYAFHWQDSDGRLKRRWDNSPHHKSVETYPYHAHTSQGIEASSPMTLEKVLEFIKSCLP